ncbi:putative cell surface metalloreductase [Phaeomoniella chlamydospora]|uniref:Putative cell surface metalloreductase n=1 Tax=Phaeomoniella chlamydospora TaxID=158046 RepID=A0A0G2ET31_PHACM|nr:putative cell surface metalloreductase [Phaeomoniella chlamydospora]
MVTSWSQGEQTALDLYVKSYRGLSATLNRRARAVEKGSVSFTTFVSGPYGISERVDKYETVLLIAGGSGIAAVIPYLKKLIYGYNTSTCHTRRVHLVWQLQTLDLAMAAEASINSLLEDDTLSDGYILTISIYVEAGKLAKLGRHERAFVVKGSVNYSRIILEEASGQHIERRSNAEESRGEVLVMVRDLLDDNVTMAELEYQPE